MSDWIAVGPAAEIPPGAFRVVELDDTRVVVCNVAGEFHAIEDLCTHDGGVLTEGGGNIRGAEIVCPRHGARFCVKTGEALSAPAYEPITTFPVRVEDGVVEVRDARWD